MKFEQYFLTWAPKECPVFTTYKEGIGICATSSTDSHFLANGMRVAAPFAAERETGRTAEFVKYAEEFQSFVGIGVSPAGMDGRNRINKVVHCFVPERGTEEQNPAYYYLDYPFEKTVPEEMCLREANLVPQMYCYRDILEKYQLDNVEKLAEFLCKIYPVMFGEDSNLGIVIGKGDDTEEDRVSARELSYLMSVLVPAEDEDAKQYRRQISYGVYTTANIDQVSYIFTRKENVCKKNFYLYENAEPVAEVYTKMAETVLESLEEYLDFMKDMMACKSQKTKFALTQLPLLYIYWKLDNCIPVFAGEFASEFKSMTMRALNSKYDREYLLKYLLRVNQLTDSDMKDVWQRFLTPTLKTYGELGVEEKVRLEPVVEKMMTQLQNSNTDQYKKILATLPLSLQQKVVAVGPYWDKVNPANREEMDMIYKTFNEKEGLRDLYAMDEKLSYQMYLLWEYLFKSAEGQKAAIQKKHFDAFAFTSADPEYAIAIKGIESMQEMALESADVVNYLRLQQLKEEKLKMKSVKKRQEEYDHIKKYYAAFVTKVAKKNWNTVIKDKFIRTRALEMKKAMQEETSEKSKAAVVVCEMDLQAKIEVYERSIAATKKAIRANMEMLRLYEEELKRLQKKQIFPKS